MTFEFRLPDIGEGVAEGEVVKWFVSVGAAVREDEPLVSVLTDKANVEIPSPKSGRILSLHAQVGDKVKVGGLLVTIDTEGEGTGRPAASMPEPAAKKTPTPVPSPATVAKAEVVPPAPPSSSMVLASPFVRRRATELGIDLSRVRGTGPGGRIQESDLDTAKAGVVEEPPPTVWPALSMPAEPTPAAPVAPRAALPSPSSEGVLERIPIRGIRRVIAEHMTESRHRAAHYTYVEEVDMTELVALRDRMAKHVEKQGVRLSYLPFVVKSVVAGLRAYPKLNATVDDARGELIVASRYHVGIATASSEGLLVPVVRDADRKSVLILAREIQELAEKGRAGTLNRAELMGSTFTITSLGALGGVLATPILNYPEVAILGVHKIQRRPVYRADGSLGPADMMNLSISLDHRVVDGYEGAQFVAKVKGYLEDPHQLFAELA